MHLMNLSAILADAAPAQQQPGPGDFLRMLVPFAIIMAGFLYVSNRSQKKRAQEHENRIKALKAGDKITTTSGLIATVITVKEDSISIRSADAKLEILKSAVADIRERAGESSAS
jgi:preprotein translocase subunit YajC